MKPIYTVLYELPRDKGIRIRLESDTGDVWVIFGHIDGMYSYCWLEGYPGKLIHLSASTPLVKREDKLGEYYDIVQD